MELWNSGASPVEARLTGWLSSNASSERMAWGAGRAVVGAGEARLLELPAGEKDLRLTLAPGTSVLAFAPANADAEDDAEALVWAPTAATTETLLTRSSRLLVFGGEHSPGEIGLELLPRASAGASSATVESSLTDQRRFEKRFPFTGAFRVPVVTAAGGPRRLHLRGARTALMRTPYHDDPTTSGIATMTPEELDEMVRLAAANGFQIAIHAIGDGAIERVLNSYELVCDGTNPLRAPDSARSELVGPGVINSARSARARVAAVITVFLLACAGYPPATEKRP